MAKYNLDVYCRRGGVSRDAGRECTDREFDDDETAVRALAVEARALKRLGLYDEVGCTVTEGERVVYRFTV